MNYLNNLFIIILISLSLNVFASMASVEEMITTNGFFTITKSETKELSSIQTPHPIAINIIIEKDTIWEKKDILDSHLNRIAQSLESCELKLQNIKILTVVVNEEKYLAVTKKRNPYKNSYPEVAFFPAKPTFSKPTLFLLKDRVTFSNKAFAMSEKSIQRAKKYLNQNWANLVNTIWITEKVESYKAAPNAKPSYSVLAHELAHNLGKLSHTDQPDNLMSSSDLAASKNDQLNADQCRKIKSNLFKEL